MRVSLPAISKKFKSTVIFVLLSFFLMLIYVDQPFFSTDEGDVFLVGSALAKGQLLYKDIASQHMPVMYYFAALFAFFGASSITAFRVCFYALMAAVWGLMYYRYSDKVEKKVVALYPVIYIILLRYIDTGYAILSDQIQGLGMAILFFELLVFEKTRKLNWCNLLMISFAVFISFGSAFTAIFGIFFVALTVISLELRRYHDEKLSFVKSLTRLVTSYWKLVAVVAAPFALMLLFYLVTGTLDDFYSWAYLINRKVYPQYVGYGGSIWQSMFSGVTNIMNAVKGGISLRQIVHLTTLAGAVYFFLQIHSQRNNYILTVGLFLVWIGSATRGMFDFHGTPAMAVLSIMNAFALIDIAKSIGESIIKQTAFVLVACVLSISYLEMIPGVFSLSIWNETKEDPSEPGYILDLITEDNEVVGFSTLDTNYIFESNTLPTKLSAACPWIWEWGGDEVMEQCEINPPRVYLYDPTYVIWEYAIVDHAADLHKFITENYAPLSEFDCDTIYVRNDYYEEATQIINDDRLINPVRPIPVATIHIDAENNTAEVILSGAEGYQGITLATWTMNNGQDDIKWYKAKKQEDGSWSYVIDFAHHEFHGRYFIHIYVVEDNKSYQVSELSFDVE